MANGPLKSNDEVLQPLVHLAKMHFHVNETTFFKIIVPDNSPHLRHFPPSPSSEPLLLILPLFSPTLFLTFLTQFSLQPFPISPNPTFSLLYLTPQLSYLLPNFVAHLSLILLLFPSIYSCKWSIYLARPSINDCGYNLIGSVGLFAGQGLKSLHL